MLKEPLCIYPVAVVYVWLPFVFLLLVSTFLFHLKMTFKISTNILRPLKMNIIIFQYVNDLTLPQTLQSNEALPAGLSYEDQQLYFISPLESSVSRTLSPSALFSCGLVPLPPLVHCVFKPQIFENFLLKPHTVQGLFSVHVLQKGN